MRMTLAPCLAASLSLVGQGALAGAGRPNVILCMADDLGWGDTGYNGNPVIRTPHLDRMAEVGLRFDRFYAAAPVCSPTRASALTGRHPFRTGVFFANSGILRPEEITIAEILKEEGYQTGHFGKWHLGTFTDTETDSNRGRSGRLPLLNPPSRHGFDVYFSTEAKVPTWDPMKRPARAVEAFGWDVLKPGEEWRAYGSRYWSPEGEVKDNLDGDDSRVIMDRVIRFIEGAARSDTPFLAVIWFHAPHFPCVAGPKYAAMYQDHGFKMRNFAGSITAMDEQIGRLRARLDELGVARDTMLWFASDNGPENGAPGGTGGYRGRKRSLYDGGVRVPGLLAWPAMIPTARATDAPAVTSDYLPTVVDALGLRLPETLRLDGVSLMPVVKGQPLVRPEPVGFASAGQVAFTDHRYKIYRREAGAPLELYDLIDDPYEAQDLAPRRGGQAAELLQGFEAWFRSCRGSFSGKDYGTAFQDPLGQRWPWPDPAEAAGARR